VAKNRLKGQEVSIRIVNDGELVEAISSFGSLEESEDQELLQDGFLGEVVDEYDEAYHGDKFTLEFQVRDAQWRTLWKAIKDRAQRRTPNVQFNVVVTDLYPAGDTEITTYGDVKWGPRSKSTGSRKDFVKLKMEGASSDVGHDANAI
jgi:hypothetical protein